MKERHMSESTELTKAQAKELAALYSNTGIEDRIGEGQEGASAGDYAMPFLALLQSGSPQVKRTDPRYMPEAREGMLMNTVDHELFDTENGGITVVPCAYRRAFVEWRTRESGGGYVKEHDPSKVVQDNDRNFHIDGVGTTFRDDKNRDILRENGNEIKDTRYWYVLVIRDDGTAEPAVIGMTRTQVKPSQTWFNTAAKNIWPDGVKRAGAPPLYVWTYRIGVKPQQKDDHSFWNFTVQRGLGVTDPAVLNAAMQLHDSVKAGSVREATDTLRTTESDSEATESAAENY
jgi:hypothetical protein